MPDEVCTYCEQPGKLIQVRGMRGEYHLKCVADAKKAWESVKGKTLFDFLKGFSK